MSLIEKIFWLVKYMVVIYMFLKEMEIEFGIFCVIGKVVLSLWW